MTKATTFGVDGPTLGQRERDFLRDADPWGFILFSRNADTPEQLRRLTGDLRDAVGRDAPVLIDQEGGRVQRLGPPHWMEWMPPLDYCMRLPTELRAEAMFLRYRLIAAELSALGIDVNCAPLLDVAGPLTHPFLRNRCYGEDPGEVALLGRAVADGLIAGGVLPVVKHMPGHGRGQVDSHRALPRTDAPRAELEARDFAPFRALSDLPMGMTAHMVFDAIDPAHPVTHSAAAVRLIRAEIGFAGLLMTDDIAMDALSGGMEQRVEASLAAGVDLILHCNGDLAERERVAAVVPELAGDALARAEAALALRRVPDDSDLDDISERVGRLALEVFDA